ncbi:MAG: CPBP family glutamic-type intramembrane protease [Opitutales bacterium]
MDQIELEPSPAFPPGGPDARDRRGLWLLIGVYLGAMGFAALLAPGVYHLIQAQHTEAPNALTREIADNSLADYFDRFRWLAVLIGLPWLIRACGFTGWRSVGLGRRPGWLARLGRGAGVGGGLLLLLAAIQTLFGPVDWTGGTVGDWLGWFGRGLLAGTLIGLLEEFLFRAMILRLLVSGLGLRGGLIVSGLFFAYTHFKFPEDLVALPAGEGVGLVDGFRVAVWTLAAIVVDFRPVAFLNLTLLGWLLAGMVVRDRDLWRAIGFHGAIVLLLVPYSQAADVAGGWWWGSARLVDGLLATVALAAYGLLRWRPPAGALKQPPAEDQDERGASRGRQSP